MARGTKQITETQEEKEMTGVCRYCCQTLIIKGSADMTEEEITEEATRSCNCDAAKTYRERIQRAGAAKHSIDELFGEGAGGFAQPAEVTYLMKNGIDAINNGNIKSVTINLNKGLKCKIAATQDDKIKVSREAKSVLERKQ